MNFSDRVGWILLGMALGYIIRLLQEMKREVDEVDEIVHELRPDTENHERNEGGFMSNRLIADIAMVLVFLMCLYATISTGITNNKLESAVEDLESQQQELAEGQERDEEIQLRLARVTVCTQQYLAATIKAANGRTTFTVEQAEANITLQRAQADFFKLLLSDPPKSEQERRDAAVTYVNSLQDFIEIGTKVRKSIVRNPYPEAREFLTCLNTKTLDEEVQENEPQNTP